MSIPVPRLLPDRNGARWSSFLFKPRESNYRSSSRVSEHRLPVPVCAPSPESPLGAQAKTLCSGRRRSNRFQIQIFQSAHLHSLIELLCNCIRATPREAREQLSILQRLEQGVRQRFVIALANQNPAHAILD